MTHARFGTLGTKPGRRDELIELLTRRGYRLAEAGCLLYEVGINDDQADAVFVAELWTTKSTELLRGEDSAWRLQKTWRNREAPHRPA
jgi:quinol monooxygenase YgiN